MMHNAKPRGKLHRQRRQNRVMHQLLERLEDRWLFNNPILVTRIDDSVSSPQPGMLRQAIITANATSGLDTIQFNIAGTNSGAHTITLAGALPPISDPLFIDGWSQGGVSYTGSPLIRIDGSSTGTNYLIGLDFTNGSNTVRGLAITSFGGPGVQFDNSGGGIGNNTLTNNYLGVGTDGKTALGNAYQGLYLYQSNNNTISNNVISANGLTTTNAGIYGYNSSGNAFTGNFIGTTASGTAALGNGAQGIYLYNGSNNRIGTNGDGVNDLAERNVISGNTSDGIAIYIGGGSNVIAGNYIGLAAGGTAALGNSGAGIWIYGAPNNRIGTNADGVSDTLERNVIGSNAGSGIYIFGASGNTIAGNYIGTDATGTLARGNGGGIYLDTSTANRIGVNGDGVNDAVKRNLISGNNGDGIFLNAGGSDTIAGNYIGVDVSGSLALGNTGAGISLFNASSNNRIGTNSDGTSDALERNILSANSHEGIAVGGGSGNIIAGNYIGFDASGTAALGNHAAGVSLYGNSSSNRIGIDATASLANVASGRNVIGNNTAEGVAITGSNNIVAGNYIGLDVTGSIARGNGGNAVAIYGGNNNRIGTNGDNVNDLAERNIISASTAGNGVQVSGSTTTSTIIAGNYIGTDVTGLLARGNQGAGVAFYSGAASNRVGIKSTDANPTAERNIIAANLGAGVLLQDAGTANNIINSNYIGTDLSGKVAMGNANQGVVFFAGASSNQITQNVIAASGFSGVEMSGPNITGNIVQGNLIGTDVSGTARLGSAFQGVFIHAGASGNLIGSNFGDVNAAAERNIISANGSGGVEFDDAATTANTIGGNYIGTDITGKVAMGNFYQGVLVQNSATGNVIDRNVIAANGLTVHYPGLQLYNSATANIVTGNLIGLDATGTNAMGNGGVGIYLSFSANGNRIGTNGDGVNDAAEANVIANTPAGYSGIQLDNSNGNQISGNMIGTDSTGTRPMPNGKAGIYIGLASSNNQIGGPSAVFGNLIANNGSNYAQMGGYHYNDAPGVVVIGTGTGNSIRANSIYNNHGIGIDLTTNGFDGVTINNTNNIDTGPNHLQNYPVILAATPGSATAISGLLNSTPNTTFTLDFYSSAAPNPALYGDGQTYLGAATVTTDSTGNVKFQLSLSAATSAGQYLTATATDPSGNTSEFSADVKLNAAPLFLNSSAWTPIGPMPISVLADGQLSSGRVADVVPDPSNANVMYLVADGGGVWKTTDWLDPQPVWTPLTDNQTSTNMGVGYKTLAIAPSNPQILYATPNGPGGGILMSTNGGSTWTLKATNKFDQAFFTSIQVDPTNSATLYVSLRFDFGPPTGVYKSTDSGSTWTNTMTTLLGSATGSASVTDLVMDPHNSQTLYAGITAGGSLNGVYRSTDGGSTWNLITGGLLTGTSVGDGTRVTVAPSNSQVIYAAQFDPSFVDHRFVSTNGGSTWTPLATFPAGDENRYFHLALTVDPNNPAIIYANGDHTLYRSTNSGLTTAGWTNIFGEDPVNVRFDDNGNLVLAGDRGVHSWAGGLAPFINKQGNIQNTENYTLTLDPTNENVVYAVAQDIGTFQKYAGAGVWNQSLGGAEVGKVLVNPSNPLRLYGYTPAGADAGPSNNLIIVSNDGGATWSGSDIGLPAASNVSNFTLGYTSQKAFAMDPANTNRMVVGITQVYETTNGATSWHSITGNADLSPGHYISAVATAASATNTVYAATDDGKFWATINDANWTERDIGLPIQQFNRVVSFQIDPTNSLHVFAVTSGDRTGLTGSHAWVTTNGGVTWSDISGNLNPENWVQSIAVDWRFTTPTLYIGTARGVSTATTLNGTSTVWTSFGSGMPNGIVEDLELLPNSNLLAAATYGRGVFEIRVGMPTAVTITSGNTVTIKRNADTIHADITANGATNQVTISQASTFTITGGTGNDTLTLDFSNGNPLPPGGISFDGGAGVNTLAIIGTPGDDTLTAGPSGLTFTGGTFSNVPINAANVQTLQFHGGSGGNDSINLASGSYTLDADTPTGTPNVSVTVQPAATATFATDQHLANLTVNGGSANLSTIRHTMFASALSITNSGLLDIANSFLYLNNTATPFATAQQYWKNGYNLNSVNSQAPGIVGDWTGFNGITSSVAKTSYSPTGNLKNTIGVYDGSFGAANGVGMGPGANENTGASPNLSASQLLIRPTLAGDMNGDGKVDDYDILIFNTFGFYNNGTTNLGTQVGDLNGDGKVNDNDILIFNTAGNYLNGTYPSAQPSTTAMTATTSSVAPPSASVVTYAAAAAPVQPTVVHPSPLPAVRHDSAAKRAAAPKKSVGKSHRATARSGAFFARLKWW